MHPTSSSPEDIARGRAMPWLIAAFFVSFVLVLAGFTVIAFRSYPGVVTENAYQKGITYNATLEKAAAQQALGWQAHIRAGAMHRGTATIYVVLKNREGAPIENAVGKVWLTRPSVAGADRAAPLTAHGGGQYEASLALPAAGLWQVHVATAYKNKQAQFEQKLVIR